MMTRLNKKIDYKKSLIINMMFLYINQNIPEFYIAKFYV